MAGDWIKVRTRLLEDPAVFRMSDLLGLSVEAVGGHLLRVWSWATDQVIDGNAPGVTRTHLDRIACVTGMGSALESVGWITFTDTGATFPNWERHLAQGAKARALTALRVQKSRNGASVTEALPEKRREEKKTEKENQETPQPPKGGGIDEIKQVSPTDGKRHKATRTRKATEAATLAQVAYVFEGRGFAGVEFANALEAFYGHRNEIGHPMTLRAASAMVTQFGNLTEREATECLVQSVANGWRGVFPEKVRRSGPAAVAAANRGSGSSIDSVIAEAQRLRELEERRTA